ncbi:hypothetical protein JTB14_035544 [Gonioctena quinquepunctata]|nr:hypothetical protein JTB14_035544 [Gonioctena quinquepunctata]
MILKFVPILLFKLLICESKLEALNQDTYQTRISLGMCIIKAANDYFTSDFEVITYSLPLKEVSNPNSFFLLSQFVLQWIGENYQKPVLVKDLKSSTRNFGELHSKAKSYIIQIRERGEFDDVIERLEKHLSWNPHAKFLVVSSSTFPRPDKIATEITKSLWEHKVVNAAVLLLDPRNTTNFNVYTWEPYSNSSCGDNFNTRSTDSCSLGITDTTESWFNERITGKLFNCTIRARYIQWPPYVTSDVSQGYQKPNALLNQGIDVNLLNMIASVLNLIVLYEGDNESIWGAAFLNETFTQDFNLLHQNGCDVLLGGYTQSYERSLYFDCSRSYIQETLIWCVPHEPITLGLGPMIHILSREVWIGVLSMYIIFTSGIWSLSKIDSKETIYKKLGNTMLNNFLVFLGLVANTLPKSSLVRFLMGILILFSLHLNMLYSSYLTSILSSHNFKEKYSSIKYIYEYNLDTYFVYTDKDYFKSYDKDEEKHIGEVPISLILQRWKNCDDLKACAEHLLTFKNSALCVPKLHKDYVFNNDEVLSPNKNLVHCLKTHVVSFPIILIMRRGFPMYDLFQKLMNRIKSAGFIAKWEGDILRDKRKSRISDLETVLDEATIKLNNLLPIFNMLLVGNIFSIVIFIGEFFAHKNYKNEGAFVWIRTFPSWKKQQPKEELDQAKKDILVVEEKKYQQKL